MFTYLRNKPAWVQLIIFGGLTAGIFLVVMTVGLRGVAYFNHMSITDLGSLGPGDYSKPQYAGVVEGMLVLQFFGVFLLPSLIFAYLADPSPLAYAGLKMPEKRSFILWGILLIVAGFFMVEWLAQINQQLVMKVLGKAAQAWIQGKESDVDNTLKNILRMKSPVDLLRSVVLVGVLAAVGEELLFRGILQRLFIQIFKSPWPGIVFTAALFSAFHGQFMGFIPRLILGVILGALYWYSGSLIPAIVGHFVYNSAQLLLLYFHVADLDAKAGEDAALTAMVGVASTFVVVILLNFLRKKSTVTYESVYPPADQISLFDRRDEES